MIRLSELFPLEPLIAAWPADEIAPVFGDARTMIERLNTELTLDGITTSILDGVVAIHGTIEANAAFGPLEIHLAAFPSFKFRLEPSWESDFFVRHDGASTDLILENMKVTIFVPSDLISSHGTNSSENVKFRTSGDTEISTEVRVRFSTSGEFRFEFPTPISFGPAKFMGISCKAIYGLSFFPRIANLDRQVDWIQRPVDDATLDWAGAIGVRTLAVDFDDEDNLFVQIAKELGEEDAVRRGRDADGRNRYEWAINDLVIPVVQPPLFPLPRHGTIGVRRLIHEASDLTDYFDLRGHPISISLSPDVRLVLSKLWFETLPLPAQIGEGLSLEAGIVFDVGLNRGAVLIGLEDELTITLSLRRSPTLGGEEFAGLHIDLLGIARIDFIAVKGGFSLGRLERGIPPEESFLAVADMLIGGPGPDAPPEDEEAPERPPGSSSTGVQIESLGEDDFSIAITDFGWKFGTFSIQTFSLPDGTKLTLGPLELILFETGLIYEENAGYFSISGGIGIEVDGFEAAVWFKRIRGKISGNEAAPEFKMDGFGGRIGNETVMLEFLGYYTNERLEELEAVKREFGFSGTLKFDFEAASYKIGLDLIVGRLEPMPDSSFVPFVYWMLQLGFEGRIPAGPVEVFGFRLLMASKMIPQLELVDETVPQLRYYAWSKRSDPTRAKPEQRMQQWKPVQEGWAVGVGLTLAFSGTGEVFRLTAFGLIIHSPDERGFMIGLELFLMQSTDPIGYAVFEYDLKNDRWALGFGVNIKLKHFLDNPPELLKDAFKIKADILIGNKPGTFALGRLNDTDSWAQLSIDLKLLEDVVKLEIVIALCVEWVEDVRGGFGFLARAEVGADLGVIAVLGYAGFSLTAVWLQTGSGDSAVRITAELGLRINVLRILQIGISLSAELEHLAHSPTYTVFDIVFTIETPWFLPNISWSCEIVDGSLDPVTRGVIAAPLMEANALTESTSKSTPVLTQNARIGGQILGSVEAFRTPTMQEVGERSIVSPDATIVIEFSQPVDDHLHLGPSNHDKGTVWSGDVEDAEEGGSGGTEQKVAIATRYQLVALTVSRRPRFSDEAWSVVEQRTPEFIAGPDGIRNLGPSDDLFRWQWAPDQRADDTTLAKQLYFNGNTPFGITVGDPEKDDSILRENPNWPCCNLYNEDDPPWFIHDQRDQSVGPVRLPIFAIENVRANVSCGPSFRVEDGSPEAVTVLSFDAGTPWNFVSHQDVYLIRIRCRAFTFLNSIQILTFDKFGEIVNGSNAITVFDQDGDPVDPEAIPGDGSWYDVNIVGGFRSVTIQTQASPNPYSFGQPVLRLNTVEVDQVVGMTTTDSVELFNEIEACRDDGDSPEKSFLLPQTEYKIDVTTRIGVRHSTTDWEESDVTEHVFIETAGFPGTNLTPQIGDEVAPYIITQYDGHRGRLYREEPTMVVFNEDFRLLAPSERTDDTTEHQQSFPVSLTVRSDAGRDVDAMLSRSSSSAADWLTDHRVQPWPFVFAFPANTKVEKFPAKSLDPAKIRYSKLLQGGNRCGVSDPADATHHAVSTDGREGLWEPRAAYTAQVRPVGSPYIHRKTFRDGDLSAFTRTGGWRFDDNALVCLSHGALEFGDDDWDLFSVSVTGDGAFGISLFAGAIVGRIAGGKLYVGTQEAAVKNASLLQVRVCADAVQFSVGEVELTQIRTRPMTGRPAVIAEENTSIQSLIVAGIEMAQHTFRASAFESFEEHIRTFDNTNGVNHLPPTEGVGDVSRFSARIERVMRRDGTDAEREELFQEVVSDQLLFLQDEIADVTISAVDDGGSATLLVIESPEPIDVVHEVQISLQRSESRVIGNRDRLRTVFDELWREGAIELPELERLPMFERVPKPIAKIFEIESAPKLSLDLLERPAISPTVLSPKLVPRTKQRFVCHPQLQLKSALDHTVGFSKLRPVGSVSFDVSSEKVLAKSGATKQLFEVSNALAREIREMGLAGADFYPGGRFEPTFTEVTLTNIRFTALQNSDATKLILIPFAPIPTTVDLQMGFEMERRRFEAVGPEPESSVYRREVTLRLPGSR